MLGENKVGVRLLVTIEMLHLYLPYMALMFETPVLFLSGFTFVTQGGSWSHATSTQQCKYNIGFVKRKTLLGRNSRVRRLGLTALQALWPTF